MSFNQPHGLGQLLTASLFGCLLFAAVLGSSCGGNSGAAQAPDPVSAESPPLQVRVCTARTAEYAPEQTFSGTVVSLHHREVCSPVEGFLSRTMIHTGEAVRADQPLMRISTAELERQHALLLTQLSRLKLDLARVRHDKHEALLRTERQFLQIEQLTAELEHAAELREHAEAQYRHARELHSADGISTATLEEYRLAVQQRKTAKEDLRRQLQSARIALRPRPTEAGSVDKQTCLEATAARADLQLQTVEIRIQELRMQIRRNESLQAACTIRAPAAGFAVQVSPQEGSYIRRGDTLLTIAETGPLYVQADISAAERRTLRTGTSVSVTSPLAEGKFRGCIHQISPAVDPRTACFEVSVKLATPPSVLVPGCQADIRIATAEPGRVLVVPAEALVPENYDSGITFPQTEDFQSEVFVLRAGRSYLRRIRVLTADGDSVRVEEGIAANEKIILSPPPALREGTRVEAVSSEDNKEVMDEPYEP